MEDHSDHDKDLFSTAAKEESLVSGGLKSSVMNGYGNALVRCSGTGDPTETLEMDWSYSPQTSQQHYTTSLNRESRWEKEKRTTKKHLVPRSESRRQRDLRRTGVSGIVMLAYYAPEGSTKALTD